jgi:hypothetical protein
MRKPIRVALLLAGVLLTLAAGCPLQTVAISAPKRGSLQDDPSVALDVKVGRNYVATSATARVDGVDLAAALGLVPPFADAAGNVMIGSDVVAVTDFDYEIPPSGPYRITATLTGLSAGDHTIDADAQLIAGGATARTNPFAVVEPFTLEAELIASSGTPPPGPVVVGDHIGVASLGESLAAPPVAISGGGEVRAGFVPAAQGRASGF